MSNNQFNFNCSGYIGFHIKSNSFIIVNSTVLNSKNRVLYNCSVFISDEEPYFANASFGSHEITILEIQISHFIEYLKLKEGQQLSLF